MARKNRKYRNNPSKTTWLLIGGAVVVAGLGYYFYTKSSKTAAKPTPGPTPTPGVLPAQPAQVLPGGLTIPPIPAATNPFGADCAKNLATLKAQYDSSVPIFAQCNPENPVGPICDQAKNLQAALSQLAAGWPAACGPVPTMG